MASIYEEALGDDFSKLHPLLQKQYALSSSDKVMTVRSGVMSRVWHGGVLTWPGLYIGALRNIMFPESGTNVPFQVENYLYRDRFGRETVSWLRSFRMSRLRKFDEYFIAGDKPKQFKVYVGTHQHLVADMELSVDERGGLRMETGNQRLYEGHLAFRFPMALSARATVQEWYDEKARSLRIHVDVKNPWYGSVFGCEGLFQVEHRELPCVGIPRHAKPVREEIRA